MTIGTEIRKILCLTLLTAVVAGCGTRKAAAPTVKRIERQPIREVTQEQLNTDSRLIDAWSQQESGRDEEALATYAAIVEKEPGCAVAWYEMGVLLLNRGWTDSARTCADRAVTLNDRNEWYLLLKEHICERTGDVKSLVATWKRLVELQPENLDYCYGLSNAYAMGGDLKHAIEVLNRIERRVGVSEPVSLQKQRLWEAAGKPDKALREIENLAAALPGDKRYNAILAATYMKQKKYAKAKACYDRVLAADPDDQYIHIQLAEYYKAVGKPDEADREMLLAFENRQLDSRTKLQLLGSFYTDEEFFGTRSATTFRLMDMAMRDCTDSTEMAAFYGTVLMRQEKYAAAAHQFELALLRDSSQYDVWEYLLICLSEVPEREVAMLDYARRAERLFPMHTLPYFLQAMAAVRQERYEEAIAKLEHPVKWGFPNHYLEADTYNLLAEACYRTGQYDRCWQAFDRALKASPDAWSVLNNYAYYLAEQHLRLDEAEQMSRRTVEAEPDNANSLDTYAWILHLLGRDREALPYMERAVKLDPGSETLQNHYKEIKASL